MHEQQIKLNGKNIFFRLTGKGPAVVLLHGFGEDGTIWEDQYRSINGFQFLVPDLPGTGRSELISDMSMEGLATCIRELTTHLDIEKFILTGHSMGGYVSLAFAEKFPEKIVGLGLFHSTAYADTEEKKSTRRKGIGFIRKNGAFEFLKTSIPNLYAPATREHHPQMVEDQIRASHNFSDAALVLYYESMIQRPSRVNILKNSHAPVLFVLGRYDAAVPLKDGLEQCYLAPLTYIHVLENSGHMGMKEETGEANSILSNYLNSLHHQTQ